MNARIEEIDYLRGLAILSIIILHIIAWHDVMILTEYTRLPILFNLRDFLQFSVITLVLCSGFSLSLRNKNIPLTFEALSNFYRRRIGRLLIPWWTFLIIFFSVHFFIRFLFNFELVELSSKYILYSFLMIGGIGFGWIVLLLLILMFLFPFLRHLFNNHGTKRFFSSFLLLYVISILLFNFKPLNFLGFSWSGLTIESFLFFAASFILGWSLIYLAGFSLEKFYTERLSLDITSKLTFGSVGLFLAVYFLYLFFGLINPLYLNKYPPSPYYLSFGLMSTFIFMVVFFHYKKFINKYLSRFLYFFSINSFWLFLWSALTISLITPSLSIFYISNIYLKLLTSIFLNLFAVIFLVIFQKKISETNLYKKFSLKI